MSNENIEENKNEGLMANTSPQVEQEAPNPEETVIPHLEDDNKDQTVEEAKAEQETKVLEKPEYIEDKFWDPKSGAKIEELSHSYKELQKQFSMGKHKAPSEYDLSVMEDVDIENDVLAKEFLDWAKENKPTQGAFDKLVNTFKTLSQQQEQEESINPDEEAKALGPNADQIISGIKTWGQGLVAKGVWSDQDFEEFKVFAATANGINALNKVRKYYGEQTIPTAPVDVDGAASKQELYEMVADPKYKSDPAFRRKVEEQFARAFPGKVNPGDI